MLDAGLEPEQEVLVLRVVVGRLHIRTRKSPNGVPVVPEGNEDELGTVAGEAPEHPHAAIPGGLPALRRAGPFKVSGVGFSAVGAGLAAPDAGDHDASPLASLG